MSRACPIAVRIVKKSDGKYHVIGRKTKVVCDTFDEAWPISVEYFAGRRW